MPEFLVWLENTALSSMIRQSLWMYPALEIVHILGIVLLVGAAMLFDLRLLGFSSKLSLNEMSIYLLLWSRRGLLLVIPSGLLLFISNAGTLGLDLTFWIKMILLALAAVNAIVFHKFVFLSQDEGDNYGNLSFRYKVPALVSIIVWIAVITCGRLLAY